MKLPLLFVAIGAANSFHHVSRPQPRVITKLSSQVDAEDRRSFLVTVAAASLWHPSIAFADDGVDYKAVSKSIADLIKEDPDKGN